MPDEFYIPGLPENLQGILYTPNQSLSETKRLRQQYAGNPGMQQQLVRDDRYWQGREMMRESPLAALASFGGSVPYDAAKLAYFNSPKPVRKLIGKATEAVFPGEGFNDQTTARPSRQATGAYLHGMAEGAYGLVRDKIEDLASKRMPEGVATRLQKLTEHLNFGQPYLSTALMPSPEEVQQSFAGKDPEHPLTEQQARKGVRNFAARAVAAHAVDPVGTLAKGLNALLQTVAPDADTRASFDAWDQPGMQAVAPGLKPIKAMTPSQKAAQNKLLSQVMADWGQAQPVTFPRNMLVQVPK